jgi:response regulator RpfG family c-di-GMP phosphodiesterase
MKTIVLIDDVQINLTLLRHLVNKIEGYESISFLNPVEALQWCCANQYDLIIVDYMMPDMSGIEFIVELKSCHHAADIPILMITADEHIDVRYQALKAGANDFLTKPIDKTEFIIRVNNMLALHESQQKLADKAQWLADEVEKSIKEIRERESELIYRLSKAAEYRDPETGVHLKRMSLYSKHIARQLGMDVCEQGLILEAAPMHDIGKVGIPDAILLKPGKLTESEFSLMKEHTKIGYEILSDSSSKLMQVGAQIALSHHEKYDGSGYPNGLTGQNIPIYGRICAVADVFDALTSVRPYKKMWAIEDAVLFIQQNSGEHFDPECVNAFFKDWGSVLAIRQQFYEEDFNLM